MYTRINTRCSASFSYRPFWLRHMVSSARWWCEWDRVLLVADRMPT